MNTVRQVKKIFNPALELEGILLTMFDGRTNLSIQVVDEVKKHFPTKVYKTIIPRNVKMSEAPASGSPSPHTTGPQRAAEGYRQIAAELLYCIRKQCDMLA
jgi:chromosome partitioning protein